MPHGDRISDRIDGEGLVQVRGGYWFAAFGRAGSGAAAPATGAARLPRAAPRGRDQRLGR